MIKLQINSMELDISHPPCYGPDSSDPFILILMHTETLQMDNQQLSPISSKRVDLFPVWVGWGLPHSRAMLSNFKCNQNPSIVF